MLGGGAHEGERASYYEVPSLEHQESSQRTLLELAGWAVSVRVKGAVTDDGTSSPTLGGRFSVSVGAGAAGAGTWELGAKASDKCVPACGGMTCVCLCQQA